MIITILIFIVVLGILVFVHEFGHFIVAKKSGMQVDEFGFGFPPRLAGIQKIGKKWKWVWGNKKTHHHEEGSTVYSINWIPLGGFVKILGENNEHEHNPKSFINRPFWGRLATLVAGVFMNLVLAWVLISAGLIPGLPVAVDGIESLPNQAVLKNSHLGIMEVEKGQPADKAGVKEGDVLVAIDGINFVEGIDARNYIRSHAGSNFVFQMKRQEQNLFIKVPSIEHPGPNQGPTGINIANIGLLSFPWYMAPYEGLKLTGIQISNVAGGLWQLVSGQVSVKNLGGPVKIAQLTGQVSRMGFVYLLQFTAFLSLNLAVLNILPFPALDGGRVLFLIIEKIRGKRNNQKVEQWVNTIGFALLLLLMLLVTSHDIFNIFYK